MSDVGPHATLPERTKTDSPGIWRRGDRLQVWYSCSGCKPDGSCPGHTETQPAGTLLKEAKARRAELTHTVASGGRLVGRKTRLSVYAPQWLETQEGNLAPKTVDTYRWAIEKHIVPALGQRYVSEITTDDVALLFSRMKRDGKKAWTIRAVRTPLSRMMSHAVRGGLAPSNPVRGLDKSEQPKGDQRTMLILDSEEIARLLSPVPLTEGEVGPGQELRTATIPPASEAPVPASAPSVNGPELLTEGFLGEERGGSAGSIPGLVRGDDLGPSVSGSKKPKPPLSEDWRPLITFLVFTGLRISEALNVRWEDIDWEAGTVTVSTSKTQAGTGRAVILIPALASTLRHHRLRSRYSGSQDYVFPNTSGGMLNRHYVLAKVLHPATEAAGVKRVTLHELRHTFASILIGQGLDVTFVADQLGHADPAITLRVYAKLFDPGSRRDEARDKLQEAFGGLL